MKTLSEFFSFLVEENAATTAKGFSIEELRELSSFDDISQYLFDNLEYIGRGKSREVWAIDETKIVKFVMMSSNARQNKQEVKHATCLGQKFAPLIYDYDHNNFFWIIEERLQPITSNMLFDFFEHEFQYRFRDWVELKKFFSLISDTEYQKNQYPKLGVLYDRLIKTSEWFKALNTELSTCNVSSEDFHDENWGLRPSTGEVVLLDLGV